MHIFQKAVDSDEAEGLNLDDLENQLELPEDPDPRGNLVFHDKVGAQELGTFAQTFSLFRLASLHV